MARMGRKKYIKKYKNGKSKLTYTKQRRKRKSVNASKTKVNSYYKVNVHAFKPPKGDDDDLDLKDNLR